MAVAIATCFPAAALAAGVARVDFAMGNVTAVATDGRSRILAKGAEIDVGDTIATRQGRAQLRFTDGALMSLQPNTEFKVEQYSYNGRQDGSENIVMNLLKGGMRTITGLIGRTNRQNYKMKTEVATIGIRGTEYSVQYTNSVEVFCANGSINVQNDGGTLTLTGGQGGFVANNSTKPQPTDEKPFLPPQGGGNQVTEKPADPTNPIQEANPPVVLAKLAGTVTGNWAISSNASGALAVQLGKTLMFDAAGTLISFADSSGANTPGGAVAQGDGNDGVIAWGRWSAGILGGTGTYNSLDARTDPLHYVVGLPATNMPTTGTATYSMLGATTPTFTGSVSSASVTASMIKVDFASTAASFILDMMVNGQTVSTGTGGIPITRSGAQLSGSSSTAFSFPASPGPFCTSTLSVQGFVAGDGAPRAGAGYGISGTIGGTPSTVNGAIAYTKTGP